jgi:hypothetical protein
MRLRGAAILALRQINPLPYKTCGADAAWAERVRTAMTQQFADDCAGKRP